jgi:hypothetical protein
MLIRTNCRNSVLELAKQSRRRTEFYSLEYSHGNRIDVVSIAMYSLKNAEASQRLEASVERQSFSMLVQTSFDLIE